MYFVFVASAPGDSDVQGMSDVLNPYQIRK